MKLKNVAIAATALALAVGMTACGSSSSTAASSSVASSAAASSEAASSEAASSEAAEPTTAEYTVYNTTGSKVTDLYLYEVGAEDKGDNLAGEGLADGDSVVITRDVEADKQADVTYVLEFTTEDGQTQAFETLHYETTPISLKSVDRRYPHRLRCTGELSLNQLASKKGCCTNAVQQPFCFKPETLRPLPPAAHRPVFCSAGACAPRCRPE